MSETEIRSSSERELEAVRSTRRPARRRMLRKSREHVAAWISLAIVFSAIVIIVSPAFFAHFNSVEPGQVWLAQTVVSPFRFPVEDVQAAETARRSILEHHPKIFRFDTGIEAHARATLDTVMTA